MTCTYIEAIKEMEDYIVLNWASITVPIFGYSPFIYFPNIDDGDSPNLTTTYVKLFYVTLDSGQATLADFDPPNCVNRYTTYGSFNLEINGAIGEVDIKNRCDLLAQAILSLLRKRTNNVIFNDAKIIELKPIDGALKTLVTCRYRYDTIE